MDFPDLIDLAGERLGGAVLLANDEFFAPKENLIRASDPVWREGEYTERGKWMDGWETRRRRAPGHDWCIIRLGRPGIIHGVVVDTSFFTGNHPESCSLDGCLAEHVAEPAALAADESAWFELLPGTPLTGGTRNEFSVLKHRRCSHVRLNIFPDGGVARLRIHGAVSPDWSRIARPGVELDLAAAEYGAVVLACSDMYFGNRHNLLMPGPPQGMHDGWETRRRRGPGHDWALIRLAAPGTIRRLLIDTTHFKGNAPGTCWLDAAMLDSDPGLDDDTEWRPLLARTPLQPHTVHEFNDDLVEPGRASHLRLSIEPDGGVARLRAFGQLQE